MTQKQTKDHVALSADFIKDEECVDWHDGSLWWIRQKRNVKQLEERTANSWIEPTATIRHENNIWDDIL